MKDIPYQSIFNILQEVLPENWRKVVFYAEYAQSSYSMKYYVKVSDGNYTDCFQLNGIPKRKVINAFANIDKQIMSVRKDLNKKDLWSVMTLIVDTSGGFKADFEYDDILDDQMSFIRKWKEKYLSK